MLRQIINNNVDINFCSNASKTTNFKIGKKYWKKRKTLPHLERKVDDCHVKILDGRSSHDIDQDVLQVRPDVVVNRGDDGVSAHNGAAQDACALSETEKD